MIALLLIASAVFSGLCTVALIPVVHKIGLKYELLDQPDGKRKVHTKPIPRVGGLAILCAVAITLLILGLAEPSLKSLVGNLIVVPSWPVVVGAVLMAILGFVDDIQDLHALPKLIVQSVFALLVVAGGLRITAFDTVFGGGEIALAVSIGLTIVWVVGIINGINFMDGMDGLAGGIVAISIVALGGAFFINSSFGLVVVAAVVLGAIFGFLKYNLAPASIFMGDVGSHFLGYIVAVFALSGTAHANPILGLIVAAVAMGLPVLDTLITLFRRPQYDKPLLHSDGDHFHHRLMERFDKPKVIRILYAISVCFATGAVAMASLSVVPSMVLFGLGTLAVIYLLYWLGYLPGKYSDGPADAVRVRFASSLDGDELGTSGDGAVFPDETTELVERTSENGRDMTMIPPPQPTSSQSAA